MDIVRPAYLPNNYVHNNEGPETMAEDENLHVEVEVYDDDNHETLAEDESNEKEKGTNGERLHEETNNMEISINVLQEGFHEEKNAMETSKDKAISENDNADSSKNKHIKASSKYYWKEADEKPNNYEMKMLVAECIAMLCKIIMSHHVYSFGGQTFLQQEHGCIGDEAIGVIALIVMIWWSRMFKSKLEGLGIENTLLKLFVDDVNGIFRRISPGTEYKDGELVYNEEKAQKDKNSPQDKVTMEVIKTIANDIEPMIKMTVDSPSNYDDQKVPMLDVKVWVNKNDHNKVYYTFYEKPTKSPFVMSKSSAMPISKKIECLGQEVFRRLHNIKREIDEKDKIDVLNDFMFKLRISGYNENDRLQILKSGMNAYEKLREKEEKGMRPFYRSHHFNRAERKEEKKKKTHNWFNKETKNKENKFSSVFFVPSTPGSVLLKMLKKTEEEHKIDNNCRIKFIETSGRKFIDQLKINDPFAKNCLPAEKCFMCTNNEKNIQL